ncbi:MAG: xanthine dehydrogenase family protein molybdopterin-binding subunit, partial [Bradyrhizobiaceae bacterium]|nr:xanthine dehydrogenase family protein molybdopterin-binding subunit [Bradyrhizobiaceae bacterium]
MAAYIGTPTSRIDGHAKVTGAAKYAAEFNVNGLLHGSVVCATITKGQIVRIDTSEARRVSGVINVLTHENRPPMAGSDRAYRDDVAPAGSPFRPLYDRFIRFNEQPIALVVAEEPEIARFAASLVRVDYDEDAHVTDLFRESKTVTLRDQSVSRGDAEQAYSASEVRHEAEYVIPMEHHNPMELFASTAIWEHGKLTVYDKTQGVQNVQRYLCRVFDLKSDDLRVVSPYTGGAFGSGLRPQYNAALAVLAALALKRSVRVVLTRQQMYALCYRPATIERLALGANASGTLHAVTHEAIAMTSRFENYARNDTGWSGLLYKSANAKYSHKLAKLDLCSPSDMRAPGAATGVHALECAMDELAVALKIDPLELRYRTYSDRDQNDNLPFTSKQLRECYRQGAEAFGWDKRNAEPRSMRDGRELIGWGMANGVWEALQTKTAARIVLSANGHAEVSCATSDIGTGTYTIMTQVAADALGLPLDSVSVKLGDSTLPQSPVEGGSWMATSVAHAIVVTADEIRKELVRLAKKSPGSPLRNAKLEDVALAEGRIVSKRDARHAVSIADAMRHGAVERIEKE